MTCGYGRRGDLGRLARAIILVVAGGAVGCETVGQDIGDFAKALLPPSPAEAARMAIDPHDPDQRREGTLLLANAPYGGEEPYLRMYRDYVENERNPLVKAVAIRALARHGEPADAVPIAKHLKDDSAQVRWEAAKGLQRLHAPAVVPELLAVLGDVDERSEVRVAVASALGQYAEDRVFQGLLAALDARELEVNLAARRSLQTLTGRDFGLDPRPWLNWYGARADDPTGNPFAEAATYRYPTYHREETWLEKLAFWNERTYEAPAEPAGLATRPGTQTYGDEASPPGEDGG